MQIVVVRGEVPEAHPLLEHHRHPEVASDKVVELHTFGANEARLGAFALHVAFMGVEATIPRTLDEGIVRDDLLALYDMALDHYARVDDDDVAIINEEGHAHTVFAGMTYGLREIRRDVHTDLYDDVINPSTAAQMQDRMEIFHTTRREYELYFKNRGD